MVLNRSMRLMSSSSCFIASSSRSLWDFFDRVSMTNERPWYSWCSASQFFFRPWMVEPEREGGDGDGDRDQDSGAF